MILSRAAGTFVILSIGVAVVASCRTSQAGWGDARWRERMKARVMEHVDIIGKAEIARLNAANETYKTQVRADPRPLFEGSYKAYEEHESYRLVDIRTNHSIFYPLRAIIEYKYVRYETAHRYLFDPMGVPLVRVRDPLSIVREDMDFRPIEERTRGFEYSFDPSGQWNGEEGKQVW